MSILFPDKKYSVIYADPPWAYHDTSYRGVERHHYGTTEDCDILSMPVGDLADPDCALFMWATFPKLQLALDTISAWGFTYKTVAFTWVKTYGMNGWFVGMGRWTRANPEVCLLATKGSPKRISGGVQQLVVAPFTRHSEKPDEVRRRIVQLMGDVPRIELFCRTKAHGWDAWGNEVTDPDPTLFDGEVVV